MQIFSRACDLVQTTIRCHFDACCWTLGIVWSGVIAVSLASAVGGRGDGVDAAGAGGPLAVAAIWHSLAWFAGMAAMLAVRHHCNGRREVPPADRPPVGHDPLTRLPNRFLLLDRLNQSVARSTRNGLQTGVLSIDLDGFKAVNELRGDKVGDRVLAEVGRRMSAVVRETDTVARLGGDEFVVVLDELPGPDIAARIANDVLEAVALPIPIDGEDVSVTASMGIAFFPTDGRGPEDLLRAADAAMREVKSLEKSGFSFASGAVDTAPARVG